MKTFILNNDEMKNCNDDSKPILVDLNKKF